MTPEVQHIAITRADGGLSVMQFVTRGLLNETEVFAREASDENINAEIAKSQIDAVSWRRIEPSDVPADRTFRNAWKDTGAVEVDMPKARDIWRDHLRALRKPLLESLDAEYQKADEGTNDNGAAGSAAKLLKKSIATKRQALRDVTADPAIDAAQTSDALKAVIPAALRE